MMAYFIVDRDGDPASVTYLHWTEVDAGIDLRTHNSMYTKQAPWRIVGLEFDIPPPEAAP